MTSRQNAWQSPTACEISDAVWSIQRAYRLVCGLASTEGPPELRRRRLQCPEDRREEDRTAICLPVDLTPVLPRGDSLQVVGPRIAAVTRDLSSFGVGLRYDRDLRSRFAVAEFDVFGDPVQLLLEFRWTYEEGLHSYVSGCRFVAVVNSSTIVEPDSASTAGAAAL